MPTFQITGPDGRKFRVTGANAEGALAAVKAQTGAPPGQPPGMDFAGRFNPPAATADTAARKGDFGGQPLPQQDAAPMGWGDVARGAVANAGPSAKQFGSDMMSMVAHPIETAQNIGNLAQGVAEKIIPGEQSHEVYANAVGKFFADRYGGVDNVKRTMATDPVGFLADLSTVLTGGEFAAARAPGVIGTAARAAGTVGRAVDPISTVAKVAKATGRGVGNVVSAATGVSTGAGGEAIRTAAKAGFAGGEASKTFTQNMRGSVPMEDVIAQAKGGLQAIRDERQAAYRAGMGDLSKDTTVLDFNKIDRALAATKPIKSFKGVSLQPSASATTQEIASVLDQWRKLPANDFHTAEGFDALKQRLGDIRDSAERGSPAEAIATQVYNIVKGQIVQQAPQYAKTMGAYAQASDLIKEIEGTLSLNRKARVDTQLRKLQSVMRDGVATNYGKRLDLVKLLKEKGATHILEALAGQALHGLEPRGLARAAAAAAGGVGVATHMGLMMNPATAAPLLGTLAASSPRLVGEAAHAGGKAARGLSNLPARAALRTGYQARRDLRDLAK